jgi:PilZ domain
MQERRREARVSVPIQVALLLPERVECQSRDINLGGMFVETERALPYGAELTMLLRLPGFAEEVSVQGTVRWEQEGGMGIQFGTMGARETASLLELMKQSGAQSGVRCAVKKDSERAA